MHRVFGLHEIIFILSFLFEMVMDTSKDSTTITSLCLLGWFAALLHLHIIN